MELGILCKLMIFDMKIYRKNQQKTTLSGGSLTSYEQSAVTLDLSAVIVAKQQPFVNRCVDPRGIAPRQPDLTDLARHLSGPTPVLL